MAAKEKPAAAKAEADARCTADIVATAEQCNVDTKKLTRTGTCAQFKSSDVPFLSRRTLIVSADSNGDYLLWMDTFRFTHHPPVADSLSDHPRLLTSPGTGEYDKHKDFPCKFFFFCKEAAGKWAETPVVLSHIIYERMKERHPDFDARLEEHGLTDIKVAGEEDDPSSFTISSWKSTYMTDDKKCC
uniref:Clavaminate synthase-like protein At3g21360 n=1 Tax=Tanacetum cinerariifolium TaxID=118510 RepID=A0A6L2JK27_TANCI|nr:clavaminate synthase-like protein At3g21360 [Tanacetum cinerariifolium]